MVKIGFYLENNDLADIDLSIVNKYNPGIGGSEYAITSIAKILSERRNSLEVFLFAQKQCLNSGRIHQILTRDIDKMLLESKKLGIDYFILNYRYFQNRNVRDAVEKYSQNLHLIIWCHNFVNNADLNYFADAVFIKRIVTVSREQMDLYRDHRAYKKSSYIFNAVPLVIPDKIKNELFSVEKRDNIVTYIGSLIPCKGFLYLAKAWKNIVKAVPDAQLYVIGGGNLYSNSVNLGPLGIADPLFEKKFFPFVSSNGHIMPSVHFMGVLGQEKNDILAKTKVGVPNPGGETETFGITAVEMQLYGCNVTTKKCVGYLDTIYNKENLYSSTNQLSKYVIRLLKNKCVPNYINVIDYLNNHFSFENVAASWESLFNRMNECSFIEEAPELTNPNFKFKRIKEKIRVFKIKHGLYRIPSVDYVTSELPANILVDIKSVLKNILKIVK